MLSLLQSMYEILMAHGVEPCLDLIRSVGGSTHLPVGLLIDPDLMADEALALARVFAEIGRESEAFEVVDAVLQAGLGGPRAAWLPVAAVA